MNAINKLFSAPVAPSIAQLYVVEGTYCLEEIRSWNVANIDVTLASAIVPLDFQF